jgi:predicted RNA-binding protein YlxR (DUF448 family)
VPVPDFKGSMSGRGGYCCRNENCINSFVKNRKRLAMAFRKKIAGVVKIDRVLIEKIVG